MNTVKHHIFGEKLWSESHRESLRIAEFLNILEISECERVNVGFVFIPMPLRSLTKSTYCSY